MRRSADVALKRYRPKFYPGEIKFIKAEVSTDFPDNPAAVWSHLAEKVEVEAIEGNHWSLLTAQFASLGSVLTRYLQEVS
jgi:thioesterase domain-containing protein